MEPKKTPSTGNGEPRELAVAFGQRLKQWRASLSYTQSFLAAELDIHVGMLKKYEAGRSMPSAEVMGALAKKGVNLGWLFTGVGEMEAVQRVPRPDGDAFYILASGELKPPTDALHDHVLAAVFERLVDLMRYEGPLFWMPRSADEHQCQLTARWATGFLRLTAGHDEGRAAALMLQTNVIDAALLLGWKFVQYRE